MLPTPPTGRRALTASLAGAVAAMLLSACSGDADPQGTPRRIAREVERTLTTVAQNELVRDPELATELGLNPEVVGFPFAGFLTDRSQAAFERARLQRLETLDVLVRTARPAPGSALARNLDAVIAAYEAAEAVLVAGHGKGDLSSFSPYVADHMSGAYLDVPELLVRRQPLETPADAQDFLARVSQLPGAIDDDRRRLEADARAGVVPPVAVLARMQALAEAGARVNAAVPALTPLPAPLTVPAPTPGAVPAEVPETPAIVEIFDNLQNGVEGLTPDARAANSKRLRDLLTGDVAPAYQRFADTVAALAEIAPAEPGIWQVAGGDAYYRAVLAAYTGTEETPAELHRRGMADVTRLTSELDSALGGVGLTEGTVSERLTLLAAQPGQLYEASDLGRAALIERLSALTTRAQGVVDAQIGASPASNVTVSMIPAAFAASAPSAAYTPRTADGRNPARFEINLSRMSDWPDYSLPTLVFHETLPGHHLESALTAEKANLPLARQLIWNAGYGEGWASYAETLADEGGLYTDDPLGRIGYLQSMLLRAARLVADTGIHQQKWSRDRAIDYIISVTGLGVEAAADEVDRYSVWPGQAAAYWIGRQRLLDLRERAQRVLGPRFDARQFHAAILDGGPRPLDMVEADVTHWYTAASR
jgi:uncharacterized protein (DUF885 family)